MGSGGEGRGGEEELKRDSGGGALNKVLQSEKGGYLRGVLIEDSQ